MFVKHLYISWKLGVFWSWNVWGECMPSTEFYGLCCVWEAGLAQSWAILSSRRLRRQIGGETLFSNHLPPLLFFFLPLSVFRKEEGDGKESATCEHVRVAESGTSLVKGRCIWHALSGFGGSWASCGGSSHTIHWEVYTILMYIYGHVYKTRSLKWICTALWMYVAWNIWDQWWHWCGAAKNLILPLVNGRLFAAFFISVGVMAIRYKREFTTMYSCFICSLVEEGWLFYSMWYGSREQLISAVNTEAHLYYK